MIALVYEPKKIDRIKANLDVENETQQANALELLEDLLPRTFSSEVTGLIEPYLNFHENLDSRLSREGLEILEQSGHWIPSFGCILDGRKSDGRTL